MAAIQHLTDLRWLRAGGEGAVAEVRASGNAALRRTAPSFPSTPLSSGSSQNGLTELNASQVLTRMGFSVDVVGYGRRTAPEQVVVQQRLAALIHELLGDLRVKIEQTDYQPNGDGIHVFLPPGIELHRALPALMTGAAGRLAADNARFSDRIRIRMATVFGPVGRAALGFGGKTIITCGRLVDSTVLRDAIVRHPQTDLAVLVADELYRFVLGEGYRELDARQFQRKRVRVKEFDEHAWLWVAPAGRAPLAA